MKLAYFSLLFGHSVVFVRLFVRATSVCSSAFVFINLTVGVCPVSLIVLLSVHRPLSFLLYVHRCCTNNEYTDGRMSDFIHKQRTNQRQTTTNDIRTNKRDLT